MLGDVFAVEVVGMPAGDLGRGRGLPEAPAFRRDFELSRLEKSPKKPGAMRIFLSLFFGRRNIRRRRKRM